MLSETSMSTVSEVTGDEEILLFTTAAIAFVSPVTVIPSRTDQPASCELLPVAKADECSRPMSGQTPYHCRKSTELTSLLKQ